MISFLGWDKIVSIPGLRGREPKEITLKNLSKIIHARVVEIIEQDNNQPIYPLLAIKYLKTLGLTDVFSSII